MANILIVDDEKSLRVTMAAFLQGDGHQPFEAASAGDARARIAEQHIDVAVVDILLGNDDGIDVARHIRDCSPDTEIILMSGQPEVHSALQAVRLRAYDYLTKPVPKEQLLAVVGRAAEATCRVDDRRNLEAANEHSRDELQDAVRTRAAQLEALANAAMGLVSFPANGNLYDFVCRAACKLAGAGVVSACSIDEADGQLVVRAVCGLSRAAETAVSRLIGRGIIGMPLDGLPDGAHEQLLSGRLVKIEGGLFEMMFGNVPSPACNAIARIVGINDIYSIGLRHGEHVFGNVTILTPAGCSFGSDAIEALANQVSVVFERRAVEDKVRQGEHRFQELVESLNDVVFELGRDGLIRYVSPVAEKVFGFAPDDVIGLPFAQFIHPDDMAAILTAFEDAVNGQVALKESRVRCKDGGFRWVCSSSRSVSSANGDVTGIRGVLTDITERKQAEEDRLAIEARLRQAQKLEAIGSLASGVAHEINNPINGIMNYAQLICDRSASAGDSVSDYATEIIAETKRVATIVRNLLSFARQEQQPHCPDQMSRIVEGTLSLVGSVLRHDQIALEVRVPDDLPAIDCRSQQIQQVIMNLATNARDAVNEKYATYDDNKLIAVSAHPFEKDGRPWIRMTVSDTGTGIHRDMQERIFDPFFTTKPRDRGTGLGLSISHGIVKDHGGTITVESEPGEWTRFHVDLPVTRAQMPGV